MKKYFGTDGIRGKIGEKIMSPGMAFRLGTALVKFCRPKADSAKIIIGRDTRESGEDLARAAAEGILAAGGRPLIAAVIPTPGLAFLTKSGDFNLGLVISASHNDSSWNGFKVFSAEGEKLSDEAEEKLEQLIDSEITEERTQGEKEPAEEDASGFLGKYKVGLLNALPKNFNAKGIKIVLDCANGAAYKIAPDVFKFFGAEVTAIFYKPDGKNINHNCGSQYPRKIQAEVLKRGANLGLAFDGDGDRVIAVDEKGQVLNGDQLLYIFASQLKEKGELGGNIVVSTLMSNFGLALALKKLGLEHFYTAVGDRAIYQELMKTGGILGGEESGHIIFRSFLSSGDGILAGLKLLEAMKYFKKNASELAKGLEFFPKLLLNVPVKHKPELSSVLEIDKAVKEAEAHFGEAGRVIVRYSGTENLCRVMVEGRNADEVKVWAEKIAGVIKKNLN